MPTARELLEQADALMRRNRRGAADDIPVLTDSVSPPPTFRVPLRPSPESAPITHPETGDAPDTIPTLTERVAGDDRAPDSVGAEGEPSDWLDLDEGNPSITGETPDSIVVVPRIRTEDLHDNDGAPAAAETIELEPAVAAEIEDAFDEELAEASEREDAQAMRAAEPAYTEVTLREDATPEALAELPARDAPTGHAAGIDDAVPAPASTEVPAASIAAGEIGFVFESPSSVSWEIVPEPVPMTETASTVARADDISVGVLPPADVPAPAATEESLLAVAPTGAASPPEPLAQEGSPVMGTAPLPVAPVPVAPLPAAAIPAPAAPADDAKWEAMAEEIRMQVLQRIDLFTDTGLREQLGRRLQPIVDRASADLVATINQHVGELLRAYVAEAIEREIDSWRKSR